MGKTCKIKILLNFFLQSEELFRFRMSVFSLAIGSKYHKQFASRAQKYCRLLLFKCRGRIFIFNDIIIFNLSYISFFRQSRL